MKRYGFLFAMIALSQAGAGHAQAVDEGEQAYRSRCQVCHSVDADGKSGPIAPNLRGVVGRRATASEFKGYSPALKKSDVVWDAKTLDAFLAAPGRVVPGTRMATVVGDPGQRQAIIKYLASIK